MVMHMDITPYVDRLRRDLVAAAEASGPEARETAERLGYALDSSARLAMMEAISHAAAEITAEMPTGGVDVRLDGRDLEFVVDVARRPPAPPAPPAARRRRAPRTTTTATSPGSPSGSPSRSRPAPRSSPPGPVTRSTPGWSTSSATATREDAINVDIDLSSIRMLGDQLDDTPSAARSAANAA